MNEKERCIIHDIMVMRDNEIANAEQEQQTAANAENDVLDRYWEAYKFGFMEAKRQIMKINKHHNRKEANKLLFELMDGIA